MFRKLEEFHCKFPLHLKIHVYYQSIYRQCVTGNLLITVNTNVLIYVKDINDLESVLPVTVKFFYSRTLGPE